MSSQSLNELIFNILGHATIKDKESNTETKPAYYDALSEYIKKKNASFNFNLDHDGLDTSININFDDQSLLISTNDIKLLYSTQKFQEDPEEYIAEQLKIHKNYYECLREKLFKAYKDLNTLIEKENEIERLLGFIPKDLGMLAAKIAKLALAPSSWIHLKSFKSEFKESFKIHKKRIMGYNIIKESIDYGAHFFEDYTNSSKPEDLQQDLQECSKVIRDISYLYSRFINTAEKMIERSKKLNQLLYPNG